MKNIGLLIIIGFVFLSCENSTESIQVSDMDSINTVEVNSVEADGIINVSADEFRNLISTGSGIVLDVRTPEETAQGHIDNASIINFYDEDFESKINLMQKDKEIYIYCRSGARSFAAAEVLERNGFNVVYNLEGGLMSWENSGHPITEATDVLDDNISTVSIEEFNELIASDQPVLIDFHTLWCAPCKKMAPIIDEIEVEYKGRAIVKRIDADASKELAKEFKVQGVPEFVLFVGGKQVWSHNGVIEKEKLTTELDKAI